MTPITNLRKIHQLFCIYAIAAIPFILVSRCLADIYDNYPAHELLARWGVYRVVRDRLPKFGSNDELASIRVVSPSGKVECAINEYIYDEDTVSLGQLQRTGSRALIVSVHQPNTDRGLTTSFVFTKDDGIRNVAVIRGDTVEPFWSKGAERAVLVATSSTIFEWTDDFCNACAPFDIPLVYVWNGQYYSESTARYPRRSIVCAHTFMADLPTDLRDERLASENNPEWYKEKVESDICGCYGNLALIGRQFEAISWINRHAPREVRIWFYATKPQLDDRVLRAKSTAYQSDQKEFNADVDNPWTERTPAT